MNSRVVWLVFALLLGLLLAANFVGVTYNCFNGYDLGIYHQALLELGRGQSLNPFVSIRGDYIFNDHLDPIIFLAAIFVKNFSGSVYATITLEWLVFIMTILVTIKLRKPKSQYELFLILTLFLFSKGILTGLLFPVHASFWSSPVWVLLSYFLARGTWNKTYGILAFLMLFKESYTFNPVLIALRSLQKRQLVHGLALLALAAIGISTAFILRPMILGPIYGHGQSLLSSLLDNPILFILTSLKFQDWMGFIKIFAPLIFLILAGLILSPKMVLKNENLPTARESWIQLFLILAPLFAIQFFAKTFGHQYGFPFYVSVISMAYYRGVFTEFQKHRYVKVGLPLIFVASSLSHYQKSFKTVFLNQNDKCEISTEKEKATRQLESILKNIDPQAKLAATGGIVPRIVRPGMNLTHIHSHSQKLETYDYLLLERNNTGNSFPLNAGDVEQLIVDCKDTTADVLLDSKYYYFARGKPFAGTCVDKDKTSDRGTRRWR